MVIGLDHYIGLYFKPITDTVIKPMHSAIQGKYNAGGIRLRYGIFDYYMATRMKQEEGVPYKDFEGDPPEDVMIYFNKVNLLYAAKGSIEALFRKIEIEYSGSLASQLINHIKELPDIKYFNMPPIIKIIEDLHKNNPEQIALIQKYNVDMFLRKG